MSSSEFVVAVHRAAGRHASRSKQFFAGEVIKRSPLKIELADRGRVLDEDDFELSGRMQTFQDTVGLVKGDEVLLVRRGGEYVVFDVMREATPVVPVAMATILHRSGSVPTAAASGSIYVASGDGLTLSSAPAGRAVFPFDPAEWALSRKAASLYFRVAATPNGTSPARTYVAGMYPVTGVAGASDAEATLTLGAAVPGSTVSVTPTTAPVKASTSFAPPADGFYVVGVGPTVSTPAAVVSINMYLSVTYA
jgi:hypothetical protein